MSFSSLTFFFLSLYYNNFHVHAIQHIVSIKGRMDILSLIVEGSCFRQLVSVADCIKFVLTVTSLAKYPWFFITGKFKYFSMRRKPMIEEYVALNVLENVPRGSFKLLSVEMVKNAVAGVRGKLVYQLNVRKICRNIWWWQR